MLDLYWGCLLGGVIFSLLTLVGAHSVHRLHGLHHLLRFRGARFLHPTTIVGGITAFGGAGLILAKHGGFGVGALGSGEVDAMLSHTALSNIAMLNVMAGAIAILFSLAIHFGYVRPMARSESSIAFSKQDYIGKSCRVSSPIRANRHGQIMITMGAGNTCEPAAGIDGEAIPTGTLVVVVEVRDHILYVSPVEL